MELGGFRSPVKGLQRYLHNNKPPPRGQDIDSKAKEDNPDR